MTDIQGLLERIRAEDIKVVDLRFTDLAGRQRHVAFEATGIDPQALAAGLLIDGSAVPGWREVTEADLLLRVDPATAHADPFAAQPTLVLLCDGADPATGAGYERDPRSATQRAEALLAESRAADRATVAIEIDVLIQDETRPGAAGAGRGASSYLAGPPGDPAIDLRAEVASILAGLGVAGVSHAQGRAVGQATFALPAAGLVAAADRVQLLRHTVHMVAASYGRTASFLARPVADQPGAALIAQLALWRGDRPVFAGQGYADLGPTCLAFIAGIMAHARALAAFTNPSTNSYRRLRPGQEEPVLIAYAAHNRSAALRIPYAMRAEGKRVEARFPDPTANPYLALTALVLAGLDGIERKLEPGEPIDRNLYDLAPETGDGLTTFCRSLEEALDALEADHEFLARGDAMPAELIEAYIRLKRREIELVGVTPHPLELTLYQGF